MLSDKQTTITLKNVDVISPNKEERWQRFISEPYLIRKLLRYLPAGLVLWQFTPRINETFNFVLQLSLIKLQTSERQVWQ